MAGKLCPYGLNRASPEPLPPAKNIARSPLPIAHCPLPIARSPLPNTQPMKHPVSAILPILFLLHTGLTVYAQSDSLQSHTLPELTVQAYGSQRSLLENTASVGVLTPRVTDRFAPVTWTNAVNTLPGVRMEERSPGSYRFSVRGSLLRSPFGVRNVKFYWNGIPFTDANGNTPLNVLDFAAIQRMEIIKGPGSSLYGAGTGGVVLMYSPPSGRYAAEQSIGIGRYGLQTRNTQLDLGNVQLQYGHQQQEGYRSQSNLFRDAVTLTARNDFGKKGTLSLLGLYSDLLYQTPGGLTFAQQEADPTQARQPTPALPGSESQNARISSRYFLAGALHELKLSPAWTQALSLYITTNNFANPFISNYEKREESGIGGRNTWQHRTVRGQLETVWTTGFEWQTGRSVQRNYDNLQGQPGPQQTSEDITALQGSAFTQMELTLPHNISVAGGLSYSLMRYLHENYYPGDYLALKKTFDGAVMPRLAFNKVFWKNWSATLSVSSGFSPPTLQEVRPSAGGFRQDLEAEKGMNRELSLRYFGNRLTAEITAYSFRLNQTIVRRSTDAGAEYFINAGKTNQNGIEWRLDYPLLNTPGFPVGLNLWHSGTLARYTFEAYISGDEDISGNALPGIPTFSQTTGADLLLKGGIGLFAVYQYGGKIFLNESNTAENSPYHQFHLRGRWQKTWGKHLYTELNASSEWVSAAVYSLGYDLNAFGNRFYNPAPKQNWYGGLKVGWKW